MMKKTLLFLLAGLMFQTAQADNNLSFKTGTYKNKDGEVTLQVQKNNMAKFSIYSSYTYHDKFGVMINDGFIKDIAPITGDTIKYNSKEDKDCHITVSPRKNGIVIKQYGLCTHYMGLNVNASGFYTFKSRKLHFFDPNL